MKDSGRAKLWVERGVTTNAYPKYRYAKLVERAKDDTQFTHKERYSGLGYRRRYAYSPSDSPNSNTELPLHGAGKDIVVETRKIGAITRCFC